MKFSHSLSFFLLCTLILSCSKSEESILSNNDLVGTWKLIDFRCDDGKTVTNFLGQTITSTLLLGRITQLNRRSQKTQIHIIVREVTPVWLQRQLLAHLRLQKYLLDYLIGQEPGKKREIF